MGDKADMEQAENPFEPYIESARRQLEEQDPVFLIGVIVALAVVVVTCGKNSQRLLDSISFSRLCRAALGEHRSTA